MLRLFKYVFILIFFLAIVQTFVQQYTASNVDKKIMQSVNDGNAQLPKMINEFIRAEKLEYVNRVVRFYATVIGTREIYDDEKSKFENSIREIYCAGGTDNIGLYAKANVAIAYSITYTSAIYGNVGWDFTFTPKDCLHG